MSLNSPLKSKNAVVAMGVFAVGEALVLRGMMFDRDVNIGES
jgi:hypothetical protein